MMDITKKAMYLRAQARKKLDIANCKAKYGDSWEEHYKLFKKEKAARSTKMLEIAQISTQLYRMSHAEIAEMIWELRQKNKGE